MCFTQYATWSSVSLALHKSAITRRITARPSGPAAWKHAQYDIHQTNRSCSSVTKGLSSAIMANALRISEADCTFSDRFCVMNAMNAWRVTKPVFCGSQKPMMLSNSGSRTPSATTGRSNPGRSHQNVPPWGRYKHAGIGQCGQPWSRGRTDTAQARLELDVVEHLVVIAVKVVKGLVPVAQLGLRDTRRVFGVDLLHKVKLVALAQLLARDARTTIEQW